MAESTLTPAQRGHISAIMRRVDAALYQKYEDGAAHHQGNLWDKSALGLIDEAINESLDMLVYLYTLRDKIVDEGHV